MHEVSSPAGSTTNGNIGAKSLERYFFYAVLPRILHAFKITLRPISLSFKRLFDRLSVTVVQ